MEKAISYVGDLSLPPKGQVTIGEHNSELVHITGPQDPKLSSFIKEHGDLKPQLQLPTKNTAPHLGISDKIEDFIEDAKATGVIPQPIVDNIEELVKQWNFDKLAATLDGVLKKGLEIYGKLTGNPNGNLRDRLAKLLIRTVAWHPQRPLLAIGLWNDTIWVYDLSIEQWYTCGLSYSAQSQVMKLHWDPTAGAVLAVGCMDGVALWHIFKDANRTDNSDKGRSLVLCQQYTSASTGINTGNDVARVDMLAFEDIGAVEYLAWDPRGELLAVASAQSSIVYVQERATNRLIELRLHRSIPVPGFITSIKSATETASTVKKVVMGLVTGESTNLSSDSQYDSKVPKEKPILPLNDFGPSVICALNWSPSGEFLLVGYQSGRVRLYESASWEHVDITDLEGPLQSVCWTPDGYNLIYSLQDDDHVRALHLERLGGDIQWMKLNYIRMAMQRRDIDAYISAYGRSNTDFEIQQELWKRLGCRSIGSIDPFGPIQELALDPHGERLIVRFRSSPLLGVILVRPTGKLLKDLDILMPTGFIQGPSWNEKAPRRAPLKDSSEDEFEIDYEGEPKAITMAFTQQFEGGSLLSMAWESGKVNFLPFYYLSQQFIESL